MTGLKFPEPGIQPRSTAATAAVASRTTISSILLGLVYTCAKLIVQAGAFFLVSKSVHGLVHSVDAVYDTVGRRSRTKFETTEWAKLLLGVSLLVGWHVVLVRMSVQSSNPYGETKVLEEKGEEEVVRKSTKPTWDRLLGRVVIPGLLILTGAAFAIHIVGIFFFWPTPERAGQVLDVY